MFYPPQVAECSVAFSEPWFCFQTLLLLWALQNCQLGFFHLFIICQDLASGSVLKNLPANAGDTGDEGSISGWGNALEGGQQPTPVLLPGKSHGQRSLAEQSMGSHKRQKGLSWLNNSNNLNNNLLSRLCPKCSYFQSHSFFVFR